MTNVIVSYDGTANDRDALALGRALAGAGANVALAYVRHSVAADREDSEAVEAARMLEEGARSIGLADAARHVVINPSTPLGLAELAQREHADIVVFGSDYRTAEGSVSRGKTTEGLLNGGPVAVAIAPAGLRDREVSISRIGVLAEGDDAGPAETARSLAAALGATVVEAGDAPVDLMVVGSRPESEAGRVTLSAATEYAIETSSALVLVVPRETAVRFGAAALANA